MQPGYAPAGQMPVEVQHGTIRVVADLIHPADYSGIPPSGALGCLVDDVLDKYSQANRIESSATAENYHPSLKHRGERTASAIPARHKSVIGRQRRTSCSGSTKARVALRGALLGK